MQKSAANGLLQRAVFFPFPFFLTQIQRIRNEMHEGLRHISQRVKGLYIYVHFEFSVAHWGVQCNPCMQRLTTCKGTTEGIVADRPARRKETKKRYSCHCPLSFLHLTYYMYKCITIYVYKPLPLCSCIASFWADVQSDSRLTRRVGYLCAEAYHRGSTCTFDENILHLRSFVHAKSDESCLFIFYKRKLNLFSFGNIYRRSFRCSFSFLTQTIAR